MALGKHRHKFSLGRQVSYIPRNSYRRKATALLIGNAILLRLFTFAKKF